jgi:hypothetical protein
MLGIAVKKRHNRNIIAGHAGGMSSEVAAGFNAASGLLSLPWWMVAVLAADLIACSVMAIARVGAGPTIVAVAGSAAIVSVLGAAWTWTGRAPEAARGGGREAVAQMLELTARAIAPGSALACLDGTAGELVELSCEKALFASPEAVASASSYVAARLMLLTRGPRSSRPDAMADEIVPGLRASLEEDRFGFVAQVLIAGYGCTADKCDELRVFRDPARVRVNLKQRPYDALVSRNAPVWASRSANPAVAATPPNGTMAATQPRVGPSPVPPGFNVPSAASIPPVSIMTPESSEPAQSPPSAATEAPAKRPSARNAPPRTSAPLAIAPPAPAAQ